MNILKFLTKFASKESVPIYISKRNRSLLDIISIKKGEYTIVYVYIE